MKTRHSLIAGFVMVAAGWSSTARLPIAPPRNAPRHTAVNPEVAGRAHWVTDYTGFDPSTNTAYFRTAGLAKSADPFMVTVTATLEVTYDCENDAPSGHVRISRAFTDVQETFRRTETFSASPDGQAVGLLKLDFANTGALRCATAPNRPANVYGPWRATNIQTTRARDVSLTATKYLAALTM